MATTQLQNTDGFVYIDIDDAAASTGPVRAAKKVLARTAVDLARHTTYALALHHLPISGASAGLNSSDDARDIAVSSFVDELDAWPATTHYIPMPGSGVDDASLSKLKKTDPRNPVVWDADTLRSLSAVCAMSVGGIMRDRRVAVAGADTGELRRQLLLVGADVAELDLADIWSADADVLFISGPTGSLTHGRARQLRTPLVVPLSPLLTTARGLAVATSAGVQIVPEFLAAAAPTVAGFLGHRTSSAELALALATATEVLWLEASAHEKGPFVGACERAESFLATWTNHRPFGRPLAP
jgi:hypothetical protein